MNFLDYTSHVRIDERRLERELSEGQKASKNLVILFTPRSGSSWITSVLSHKIGIPEEYLNPAFIPDVAASMNGRSPEDIISLLQMYRKTCNDIFSIEVTSTDIDLFGEELFLSSMKGSDTKYCFLFRQNIIAQGVSLYKAIMTGRFHSNRSDNGVNFDVEYNKIKDNINHILAIENSNVDFLRRNRIDYCSLSYESACKMEKKGIVEFFSSLCGVNIHENDNKHDPDLELQKIGDEWNVETEFLFRRKHKKFVEKCESSRLLKLSAPATNRNSY